MRYFKQEDFDKCMEFLKDKPDTVETQQELYKFMHEECKMFYVHNDVTVKNMCIYSKVYVTRYTPNTANWCATMSDGSQVIWNRKYQEFYWIDEVGIDRCDYLNYQATFTELMDIDHWLLENWIYCWFKLMQKQLVAIWDGKYAENFKNWSRE